MKRLRVATLGITLTLLTSAGCGADSSPHGAEALKTACDGIIDSSAINEARTSSDFDDLHVSAKSTSHASAAKALLDEDHAAYACRISRSNSPELRSDALYIKFTPGLKSLFPEDQEQSYSSYRAYKLGNGMQATMEAGSADVYYPCQTKNRDSSFSVTGSFFSTLDLSPETRFRTLFRSSEKMSELLKCENDIKFPDPATMKYLPLQKD
ncbi:hypothetical protein EV284_2290 [Streptomyces sp. BK022]|uniref:hypothetical protein n=1 Tax=Streptomyces sp. BK022 TaxID=2512123 RepID=UPI001029AF08|nr:hypothetical protein [Streptomyces sp. BK022]RZU44814.1 hypothetical protein EV284_2290 [Streptomyces sp. BK022]